MATETPTGLTKWYHDNIAGSERAERLLTAIDKGCIAGGAGENNFLVVSILKEIMELEEPFLCYATIRELASELNSRLEDFPEVIDIKGTDPI